MRYPSITALRALDAVARLGSVTAAAQQLSLTRSAISHQIKALDWQGAGIASLKLIGDAAAPAPIAWATYAGRRFAEELDTIDDDGDTPRFRREIAALAPGPSRLP